MSLDEAFDLRGPKGGQVVELCGDDVVFEARSCEHPPVADETDMGDAKTLLHLVHLGGDGLRIPGVALEDLDRDRCAILSGEQSIDDLEPPTHAVFRMPERTKGTGPVFEGRRGYV